MEYRCENSLYRHRITCRRGKILPRLPICFRGKISFFFDSKRNFDSNSSIGCRVNNDNVTFSKRYYRHREHVSYSCPENQMIPLSNNKTIRCLHGNLSSTPVCQPSKISIISSLFFSFVSLLVFLSTYSSSMYSSTYVIFTPYC